MQNGKVPQHGVANMKQNRNLRWGGSPEDRGLPVPCQAPQPRTPEPEGRVSTISGCEKQRQLNIRKTKGCRRLRHTVLKFPVHELIHTKLQCRGRKKLDIWGGIYGEEQNWLTSGQGLKVAKSWQAPLFLYKTFLQLSQPGIGRHQICPLL